MRPYDPQGVYTPEQVVDALSAAAGTRTLEYRFERLTSKNEYIEDLDYVVEGQVKNSMFSDIRRSASFTIKDDGGINYLSDRIKPYVRLRMPDGGYVEWPQGVFLLSTPSRSFVSGGALLRDVEGYDQLLVLKDDKVATRYTVTSGTLYTTAITTLLSGMNLSMSITPSTLVLPAATEWDPGTSKLEILNDLLGSINYESAFFDEDGKLVCRPYQSPSNRTAEYTYATDKRSIITGDVSQTLDLYAVPNQWVLVVSNPDTNPLTSTYTNTSLSSPTSTVSRGRTIVDFRSGESAADQATLDAKVARLAFEASQVYEIVEFQTANMPIHQNGDVYNLDIDGLDINASYSETEWTLTLAPGATMKHKARRIVTL